MEKIKIIIEDGIVTFVGSNMNSEILVEIVDFNKNDGDEELLEKEYSEPGIKEIGFTISHCTQEP